MVFKPNKNPSCGVLLSQGGGQLLDQDSSKPGVQLTDICPRDIGIRGLTTACSTKQQPKHVHNGIPFHTRGRDNCRCSKVQSLDINHQSSAHTQKHNKEISTHTLESSTPSQCSRNKLTQRAVDELTLLEVLCLYPRPAYHGPMKPMVLTVKTTLALVLVLFVGAACGQPAVAVDGVGLGGSAASLKVVPVQGDEVQDLCDAQCAALCLSVGEELCQDICGKSGERRSRPTRCSWMLRCQHSGCTGSCSTMPNADMTGPVPVTPAVSIQRDPWSGDITLSWDAYDLDTTGHKTVYLVSQKTGDCAWAQLGWVMGNRYIVTNITDMCKQPTFRVAAVNRFGSRWFSQEVKTPELLPGRPRNLSVRVEYKEDGVPEHDISFYLEWRPPDDWPLEDIHYHLSSKPYCDSFPGQIFVYRDNTFEMDIAQDQKVILVTGRISIHAMSCRVTFMVRAVPKCAQTTGRYSASLDSVATTEVTLDCGTVPGYNGKYCQAPPPLTSLLIDKSFMPGPVQNVTLVVMPMPGGQLKARVSWGLPTHTGYSDHVETYYLFWGLVQLQQDDLVATFKTNLHQSQVPGSQFEDELLLNISSFDPYETLGVVIQAAGPDQTVETPISTIHKSVNLVSSDYDITPDDVLVNDSVVYVIQKDPADRSKAGVDVHVFWRRPTIHDGVSIGDFLVTLQSNDTGLDTHGNNSNNSSSNSSGSSGSISSDNNSDSSSSSSSNSDSSGSGDNSSSSEVEGDNAAVKNKSDSVRTFRAPKN